MLSDPHYFDPALGTTGEAFEEYLAGDRKLVAESHAILESALEDIKASDTEALIIPGDLTKDGELSSHENVVDMLEDVEDTTDIEVYVMHGNHDILNPIAVGYEGENEEPVETITDEQYKEMYDELGYGQAVAVDPNSLSYTVDLDEDTRLIVMDSVLYEANFDEGYPQTGGAINHQRMDWILGQIDIAQAEGKQILGMTHHGIVEHFAAQDVLFPQYVVENWQEVSAALADAGMHIVFTGHFHSQDAAKTTTDAGNTIYDIETGSLVTYPSPYREVELTEDEMNVRTEYVTDIDYDTGGQSFPEYSKEYLTEGMQVLIPSVLTGMTANYLGIPEALVQSTVRDFLNTSVAPNHTLLDLATDAIMQHYAGDEQAGDWQQQGIQTLLESEIEIIQTLGAALKDLYNDSTPDNNFTIELDTLSKE